MFLRHSLPSILPCNLHTDANAFVPVQKYHQVEPIALHRSGNQSYSGDHLAVRFGPTLNSRPVLRGVNLRLSSGTENICLLVKVRPGAVHPPRQHTQPVAISGDWSHNRTQPCVVVTNSRGFRRAAMGGSQSRQRQNPHPPNNPSYQAAQVYSGGPQVCEGLGQLLLVHCAQHSR